MGTLNDLNELFKIISEGKADYKKNDPVGKAVNNIKQTTKSDLSLLFTELSESKKNDPMQKKINEVKNNVKSDLSVLFEELSSLNTKLHTLEQYKEPVTITEIAPQMKIEEAEIPAQPVIKTPQQRIKDTKDDVKKYLKDKSFQQPTPDAVNKGINDLRKKITFLEQAIGRIAAAGPGGGEVNLKYLDDIDKASIADGKYLQYNDDTGKFEFSDIEAVVPDDFVIDGEEF